MIEIAQISNGGSFLKPAEMSTFDALLVEPKRFEAQRPSGYGPKDTVVADITAFSGDAEPVENLGVMIQQTILVKDLQPLVGKATIVKLEQGEAKKGQNAPWVWRSVSQELQQKVIDYATEREAKTKAELDDAPPFA